MRKPASDAAAPEPSAADTPMTPQPCRVSWLRIMVCCMSSRIMARMPSGHDSRRMPAACMQPCRVMSAAIVQGLHARNLHHLTGA